jgi:Cd2+/Zn2+-exporting ATPase
MTQKQKRMAMRIVAGAALFVAASLLPLSGWWRLGAFLLPYLLVGGDILLRAARNLKNGQWLDENFLMTIATIGAFLVGEYPEGAAVMLFYQVGELFQSYAVHRSRKSIAQLMDIRPDHANIKKDGELLEVDPEEVEVGQIIWVRPGERIPMDGVVTEGESLVDTSALTGEPVPRSVVPGQEVLSGCINQSGLLAIRTTKAFEDSTVAKILDLVENASSKKAKAENFITKFARYYTPAVVGCAAVLAVVPPLVLGGGWSEWIHRALIFLVISCPCALVISVPLSFFGGIGGASWQGILVKGSNYLEALADAQVVVMDKTGTLTKGTFQVTEICPQGMEKEQLLYLAAHAECFSTHPIGLSLRVAYGKEVDGSLVSQVEDVPGHGILAQVDGKQVAAGNRRLMERMNLSCPEPKTAGTVVHVAVDGRYAGYLLVGDEIKEGAKEAIAKMRQKGVSKLVMLTGDSEAVGRQVADQLGLDQVCAQLLPGDKVDQVEQLMKETTGKGKLIFVGDGLNDAPVLSRADVGIAMGALGTDAAIEAADVVIMNDQLEKIPQAMGIARKTLSIVRQNIVFALAVKLVVLVMGALGLANMWWAVFADVGVSVIAILNAMRAMATKKE